MKQKAKRFNKGKTRYELIPPNALKALADVYTRGAHKYSVYKDSSGRLIDGKDIPFEDSPKYELVEDGVHNWRKGMSWTGIMDSTKRHIEAFRLGEDFDEEMSTYHLGNAAWGLFTLLEYYKIAPQFDDRIHIISEKPKYSLDIDEVLADWVGPWITKFGIQAPTSWFFDYQIMERFEALRQAGELDDFYLNLKPLISPADIHFEPHCYVTSRPVSSEVTQKWLEKHGFPLRPVHTVPLGGSKLEVIKASGADIHVDDRYETYEELNRNGVCCYLYDAPHNQRYDVGYRRIKSLKDLK